MNSFNKTFRILTIAIFIGLLLPFVLQDGMFVDGVTYSSISKNLANDLGKFWKPHYTRTLYPGFFEHPPLVFGIQSLFFRLFGNGMYTERIYSLFTAVVTMTGIVMIWRQFTREKGLLDYYWLPVFLWILTPVVFWSYRNNLLENTLSIFSVFAVYFICRSLLTGNAWWIFAGGILILLAFFAKGPVGLFPVATVVIFRFIFKTFPVDKTIWYSIILILFPAVLFYLLVMLQGDSGENIRMYLNQQIIPSLTNSREITTDNRFTVLFRLLIELLFPILLFVFLFIRNRIAKGVNKPGQWRTGLFFILIGLSASLPLLITSKQRAFYLVPSIPFFVIGCGILIGPYIRSVSERFVFSKMVWMKRGAYFLILAVVVISFILAGRPGRDRDKLHDVYILCENISSGRIISTTNELCTEWGFIAYLCRYGYLSLDCDQLHNYHLIKNNEHIPDQQMQTYQEMNLGLINYRIYKRKSIEGDTE